MPSSARLLALAALLFSASAIVPPGHQGAPNQLIPVSEADAPSTDAGAIEDLVGQVDQKGSPSPDAAPSSEVPPVTVTALDGSLTSANTTVSDVAGDSVSNLGPSVSTRSVGRLGKRTSGFTKIFDGLAPGEHDASIQGTAYLTYTVVSNATYNVDACLEWCAKIDGCAFVNVYYEFNNYLLDFVFGEKSNLKCAAYGDIHNATEKLNFGGQQSYPQVGDEPVPLTYITQSSGYALDDLLPQQDPEGYELVFGPTGGANNAPGYMGFAFLDRYDVNACAQLCNGRGEDPVGGGCAYFNIWRAVVNGVPTTYTCSMYYLVADESTAVNFGQGDLKVTLSRGYKRQNLVIDGGFEGFNECDDFCFTEQDANWIGTSPAGGSMDATIFWFADYSHFGSASALFGDALGRNALPGTLRPAKDIVTEAGAKYVIQCFFISSYSGSKLEAPAKVDILWNNVTVGTTHGFVDKYTFTKSDIVVGTGSDKLSFVGGAAPAWTFLDDVKIYKV